MVVSISEPIWSINLKEILTNHNPFIRHIWYVDNRLIFGNRRLCDLPPFKILLDVGFYRKPILLETGPDQEFLGSMLETNPFELIYCGPTNVSQVRAAQWVSLPMPHRHQRRFSSPSCSPIPSKTNSAVLPCRLRSWRTQQHFCTNSQLSHITCARPKRHSGFALVRSALILSPSLFSSTPLA